MYIKLFILSEEPPTCVTTWKKIFCQKQQLILHFTLKDLLNSVVILL